MASKSIGSLYAELTLRDGKFTQKLKNARKSLSEFGSSTMKYAGVALGAAATGIGAGLTAGTLKTLDQVDALKDLSDQTGLAIDQAAILGRAYKDGGRDAEMLGKDIGKMQKALVEASSGGNDPFAAIGLSASELMQMDPAVQFQRIGDAIMRIQNPAERTAKAMEIFGKGGMGLTTVFPGMEGAVKAMGRMPQLAKEFGAAMGEANDLIGHLPVKSDQFFMGFTAGIIGTILPNLQKVDDFDFTKLGQNLGQNLANAFSQISDSDRMWQIWSLKGMIAITNVAKGIGNTFGEIGNTIEDIIIRMGGSKEVIAEWDKKQAKQWKLNPQTGQYDLQQSSMFNDSIDVMQQSIDGLTKFEEKVKRRRAAFQAADLAFSNLFDQPTPSPLTDIFKTESMPSTQSMQKAPDRLQYQSGFTDYQRRGLGSGIAPVNESKVQKQIDLLQGIRDILKQATLDGATLKF